MKSKLNIISIILGLIFIVISVYIGYINSFQGNNGLILLIFGTVLTIIGVIFTPKIWEHVAYIIDIVVMFFSKPWFATLIYCDLKLKWTRLLFVHFYTIYYQPWFKTESKIKKNPKWALFLLYKI